jgi:hypothetical protein
MSRDSKDFRRRNRIGEQFAPRTIRMLESPAYRALSLSAHRCLSRIEIERAHHAGHDNGKLPVTYDQFVEYGVHGDAIAPALRELEALGFIEVTERGRAGNAEWRRPNLFRLTFHHVDRAAPTNEWQRIKTDEDAVMSAKAARRQQSNSRRKPSNVSYFPPMVFGKSHPGNHERKPEIHTPETMSTGHTPETMSTSIFSGPTLSTLPYAGWTEGQYLSSTDPRAFHQFKAVICGGRPYLAVGESPKSGRRPSVGLRVLEVMPKNEALSIPEISKRTGMSGLGPVIQAMHKAGKVVRVGRGKYRRAA